jgi:hypothetical protein
MMRPMPTPEYAWTSAISCILGSMDFPFVMSETVEAKRSVMLVRHQM